MPTLLSNEGPMLGGAPVTPSDTTDLPRVTRGIIITVLGTVKVTMADDSVISFLSGSLAIGVVHPLAVRRIWSTGTAATGIFGLY